MSSSSDGSCKSKAEAVIMDSRPTRYMSLSPKKKKKKTYFKIYKSMKSFIYLELTQQAQLPS